MKSRSQVPAQQNEQGPSGANEPEKRLHLAFFLHHLKGGGVSRMRLILTGALADRGHKVDLIICEPEGPLGQFVPENVRVISLNPSNSLTARVMALAADPAGLRSIAGLVLGPKSTSATLNYLPDLVRYLRREQPDVLFAASTFLSVEASLALRYSNAPTRLVVAEHIVYADKHPFVTGWHRWYIGSLLRRTYSRADVVLAISEGVADEMARRSGFPRDRIQIVTNPTVTPELDELANEPLNDPWFAPNQPPVVLGVGRLSRSKDFATLIRAFARVRKTRPLRLVILGASKTERKTKKRLAELQALASELGVLDDVALPGFVSNPYKYMARAGVFVLSSHFEGLPNALIEAMACGCPVVSTDTPSGPREILEGGEHGPLVDIGDDEAMAAAISATLNSPPDQKRLRRRAADFSVDRAIDSYEQLALSIS